MLRGHPRFLTACTPACAVNWRPWSVCTISGWPWRLNASCNTSIAWQASNVIATVEAQTLRLAQSLTAVKDTHLLAMGMYVVSSAHTWFARLMRSPLSGVN